MCASISFPRTSWLLCKHPCEFEINSSKISINANYCMNPVMNTTLTNRPFYTEMTTRVCILSFSSSFPAETLVSKLHARVSSAKKIPVRQRACGILVPTPRNDGNGGAPPSAGSTLGPAVITPVSCSGCRETASFLFALPNISGITTPQHWGPPRLARLRCCRRCCRQIQQRLLSPGRGPCGGQVSSASGIAGNRRRRTSLRAGSRNLRGKGVERDVYC